VYVLPGLVGAGLAAVVYDALATPRKITAPIKSAVTHPDAADAGGVAAVK
jgi:glycerol uptake facilitator protein